MNIDRSIFVRPVQHKGYRIWSRGLRPYFTEQDAVTRHVLKANHGIVNVDVIEQEISDFPCHVYAWSAELMVSSSSRIPEAVAIGTFFRTAHRITRMSIGAADLILAADDVNERAVHAMEAFVSQHQDAESLIAKTDVCVVGLWERRQSASRGRGKECLIVAMNHLKKQFQASFAVVLDVKPLQFRSWWSNEEPADVQVEKQEAINKLRAYVHSLGLPGITGGDCRTVVSIAPDEH